MDDPNYLANRARQERELAQRQARIAEEAEQAAQAAAQQQQPSFQLRANDEVTRDLAPDRPAPMEADVEVVEPEIRVSTLRTPTAPSKEQIEKHNLLHDPPQPWCNICIQAKGKDACHRPAAPRPIPLIQIDYAEAGEGGNPNDNFEFIVGTDMVSGSAWASSILVKGKEDQYVVNSLVSFLKELGYPKIRLQSDGAPAAVMVVEMAKNELAKTGSPMIVMTQTSERYSHQSNGGAERMVQTIRNQCKAYTFQVEEALGIKLHKDSEFLSWCPRQAAWQYTRFHERVGGGTPWEATHLVKYNKPILMPGEAVACRRPGANVNKLESAWLEGIWIGRDTRTDEHFVGTPGGLVRSRAIKRRTEEKRWDLGLFQAMKWTPWVTGPTTRGRPPIARTDQEPILLGPLARPSPAPAPVAAPAPDPSSASAPAAASTATSPPPSAPSAAAPTAAASTAVAPTAAASTPAASSSATMTVPGPTAPPSPAIKRTHDDQDPPSQAARPSPPVAAAAAASASAAAAASGTLPTRTDEDDAVVQRRRIGALLAACLDQTEYTATRAAHLAKISKPSMVRVVKTVDAETRPLSGRWVDTIDDNGTPKSRWTTRGFEQHLEGDENFYSGTPALCHLKALLVLAELEGHVAALGDCSGAFYQSPLQTDGGKKVYLQAPPEAGLADNECWEAICAFPGLKGAPRAWQKHSTSVLVNQLGLTQSRYDDCCFRQTPKNEASEDKPDMAGRREEKRIEQFGRHCSWTRVCILPKWDLLPCGRLRAVLCRSISFDLPTSSRRVPMSRETGRHKGPRALHGYQPLCEVEVGEGLAQWETSPKGSLCDSDGIPSPNMSQQVRVRHGTRF